MLEADDTRIFSPVVVATRTLEPRERSGIGRTPYESYGSSRRSGEESVQVAPEQATHLLTEDISETTTMTTSPLTIEVDAEAARAFEAAPADWREKMQLLLGLRLRELVAASNLSLREAMDDLGREAERRGLTPEILDSILREEDDD